MSLVKRIKEGAIGAKTIIPQKPAMIRTPGYSNEEATKPPRYTGERHFEKD